jgi:hypothetical protein
MRALFSMESRFFPGDAIVSVLPNYSPSAPWRVAYQHLVKIFNRARESIGHVGADAAKKQTLDRLVRGFEHGLVDLQYLFSLPDGFTVLVDLPEEIRDRWEVDENAQRIVRDLILQRAGGEQRQRKDKKEERAIVDRGRPKDTNEKEDQRIYEAWNSRSYRTYEELGNEMRKKGEEIKRAIDRHRHRKRNSNKQSSE